MCSSEENSFFFPIPIRFFNTQLKRKIGNFFSFNRERTTRCCRPSDDDVDLDDESDDDDDENNHHHRFFFFLARAKPRVSLRVVSRARRTDDFAGERRTTLDATLLERYENNSAREWL